jgi:hypothetical protein
MNKEQIDAAVKVGKAWNLDVAILNDAAQRSMFAEALFAAWWIDRDFGYESVEPRIEWCKTHNSNIAPGVGYSKDGDIRLCYMALWLIEIGDQKGHEGCIPAVYALVRSEMPQK